MSEPRLYIVTRDPRGLGGVASMARLVYETGKDEGYDPCLVCNALERDRDVRVADLLNGRWLGDIEHMTHDGMELKTIPRLLPEAEFLQYRLNQNAWERALDDGDAYFCVAGSAITGHPLALAGHTFGCWVATPFWEDRVDRLERASTSRRIRDRLSRPVMEAVERRVLRNADPVYVLSDYTADRVAERHGVSKSGIETVPYPVDTTLFSPDGERENLPSEGPTLLFVGRFNDPRKNVKLLVDAIAQLCDDHDLNATLLLVGAAPDSNLTEYVAARGLSSAVEYVEYVKNETLPACYRAADAFVIPSNQEGLAIVGLEAMACGTPVVSTRCGGPEGYVEDGETGYLVPTDDKAALADRLARLLSDDDLRQEMGRSAHALVNSSYAESVVGPRFTAALTELVERTT